MPAPPASPFFIQIIILCIKNVVMRKIIRHFMTYPAIVDNFMHIFHIIQH